jgi:hypothetical protein
MVTNNNATRQTYIAFAELTASHRTTIDDYDKIDFDRSAVHYILSILTDGPIKADHTAVQVNPQ